MENFYEVWVNGNRDAGMRTLKAARKWAKEAANIRSMTAYICLQLKGPHDIFETVEPAKKHDYRTKFPHLFSNTKDPSQ